MYSLNPFHVTGFFLFPLKTSENQRSFRGYRKRPVARNVLSNMYYCKDIATENNALSEATHENVDSSLESLRVFPMGSCLGLYWCLQ